jgi:NADH-quinone oxidoreductase subunit E
MTKQATGKTCLSQDILNQIDAWIIKYPAEQRQSAVMAALMYVQDAFGYISEESMNDVANYLNMPLIAVCEVASFYSMYRLRPSGKNHIDVCTNISCQLNGADEILKCIEHDLEIKCGETTADGKFHLRKVECLGACANAPAMQINKDYHENLVPEKLREILSRYTLEDK